MLEDSNIQFVPNRIIVKFSAATNPKSQDEALAALNQPSFVVSAEKLFKAKDAATPQGLERIFILSLEENTNFFDALNQLEQHPSVEYAEPDYVYRLLEDGLEVIAKSSKPLPRAQVTPNDALFVQQWAHSNMRSEDAWNYERGSPNIVIAVVDTGVDYLHEDLYDNKWENIDEVPNNGWDDDNNGYIDDYYGYDFYNYDSDPMDDNGHGTHVSGIAAAVTNNWLGVSGTCWHCKIMALKFLDAGGSGPTSAAALALKYAADNGADVISNSWGGGGFSQTLEDAVNYAYSKGAFLVAAAGNAGENYSPYPAAYENMIAVAATNQSNEKAAFNYGSSNYGSWIEVAAPGKDIVSTLPYFSDASYGSLSGTSMATPYVSGLAGLVLSKNSSYTNEELLSLLRTAVTTPANDTYYVGTGIINAFYAVATNYVSISNLNSTLDDLMIKDTRYLDIRGSAYGRNYRRYKVEYGLGQYPSSWTLLASASASRHNATLAALDTLSVSDGVYTVKLTSDYGYDEGESFDMAVITIDNNYISQPMHGDVYRKGAYLEVRGSAQGLGFASFTLEYGQGKNPSSWSAAGITLSNNGLVPVANGTLGLWDTSVVGGGNYYTLRLTVNFAGRETEVVSSIIYIDPLQKPGWPQKVGRNLLAPAAVGDTDEDGDREIFVGESRKDREVDMKVYGFNPDGTLIQGWPNSAFYARTLKAPPALANIDAEDDLEIFLSSDYGYVWAWKPNGTRVPGWPSDFIDWDLMGPAIGDIDNDGEYDIVVTGTYGKIAVLDKAGNLKAGWPVSIDAYIISNPSIADIDNDGYLEIIVGTALSFDRTIQGQVYAFKSDGRLISGWPVITDGHISGSPTVADINQDGSLEIVFCAYYDRLYALTSAGQNASWWPTSIPCWGESEVAIGDIDGNGDLEIVFNSIFEISIVNHDGTPYPNWPVIAYGVWDSPPILGDIDGDGDIEILENTGDDFDLVYAFHHTGVPVAGWPKVSPNIVEIFWRMTSPDISDIDNDGTVDIVLADRSHVLVWNLTAPYRAQNMPWPMFQHDLRRTGQYKSPQNSPPQIVTSPVTNAVEGQLYSYDVNAVDPDGDKLFYALKVFAAGMTINKTTGLIRWTPTPTQSGAHAVAVRVSDERVFSFQNFTIQVGEANRAPELGPLQNPVGNEAEQFKVNVTAADQDGDLLNITLNDTRWTPTGPVSFRNNSNGTAAWRVFYWNTVYSDSGIYSIKAAVSDSRATSSATFQVTVRNVNRAPVLSSIPNITVAEGARISLSPNATDPDNQNNVSNDDNTLSFTFSWPLNQSGQWQTDYDDAGNYMPTVTVSDGSLTHSRTLTITVTDVNRPPAIAPVASQALNEGQLAVLNISVSDPDGDLFNVSVNDTRFTRVNATTDNSSNGTLARLTYAWQTNYADAGIYLLQIRASDRTATIQLNTTITIIDVNRPPSLAAVPNVSGIELDNLSVTLSASDLDGDLLALSLNDSRWTAQNATFSNTTNGTRAATTFFWKTTEADSGSYSIGAAATDGRTILNTSFTATVQNLNRPPILGLLPNITAREGDLVVVNPTASDPDNQNNVSNDDNSLSFAFSWPLNQSGRWQTDYDDAGTYPITVRVSDGQLNDSQSLTVTVLTVIWCQDTLTQDTVLDHDITNCQGTGLVIGNSHIALDCRNHTLNGTGNGDGVYVLNKTGVTIRNCAVTNFRRGLTLNASRGNLIQNSYLLKNGQFGAYLASSQSNTFIRNNFSLNFVNAYEDASSTNNSWNQSQEGNRWSDVRDNPGYPFTYIISGPGDGIDFWPWGPSWIDLKALEFSKVYPEQPNASDDIMFIYRIANFGTTDAATLFFRVATNSTVPDIINTVPLSVPANSTFFGYVYWKYPAPGTYRPTFFIDAVNTYAEIDEANNAQTATVVVGPGAHAKPTTSSSPFFKKPQDVGGSE